MFLQKKKKTTNHTTKSVTDLKYASAPPDCTDKVKRPW